MESRKNSDVDVMIIVAPEFKVSREHYRLWDEQEIRVHSLPTSVSFVRLSTELFPANILFLEAAVDGKLIFDPSGQIHLKLTKLRQAIADNTIYRKYCHGQSYWVEKESENV